MNVVFTLFFSLILSSMVMGQSLTAVIKKADVAPVIDGVVDEVWSKAPEIKIEKVLKSDTPDIGESTWQALWDFDGLYILLKIDDDAFYPGYIAGSSEDWNYDLPGFSIDVNPVLEDGVGSGAGSSTGHYGFGPIFSKSTDNTLVTEPSGFKYFHKVMAPSYIAEYFVPFSMLKDRYGNEMDIAGEIGFDVNIIDRDPGDPKRGIAVWSNSGEKDENYNNMDDAGHITLEGADDDLIYITSVTLDEGSININGGSLKIGVNILPENASIKKLDWTVEPSTYAKISSDGILTALKNGIVKVKAATTDGTWLEATTTVIITGQEVNMGKLNVLKNGNFDDGLSNWSFFNGTGGVDPDASNGTIVCDPGSDGAAQPAYMYQFSQKNFSFISGIEYIFGFQAWADKPRSLRAVIETSSNGIPWIGKSIESSEGAVWNSELTTEPVNYIYHINFNDINDTPKLAFYLAGSNIAVNLDSIFLVTAEDYDLIISTGTKSLATNKAIKVYPNPIDNQNTLNIETAQSGIVSIYNSTGQKQMEKMSTGNLLQFDISGLKSGLYFVKLGNGTGEKFIVH